MQINVGGNGSDFGAEACDLVSEHAWGGNLDGVIPVVVVVAKSVCEVENSHLADLGVIFSHVEMSRLHTTLSHRVGHQEEVKSTIDHFALLHEALVNVGALRWVINESLAIVALGLLEEALAHALVDDDERNFGPLHLVGLLIGEHAILL